jgi:hypothetical protein
VIEMHLIEVGSHEFFSQSFIISTYEGYCETREKSNCGLEDVVGIGGAVDSLPSPGKPLSSWFRGSFKDLCEKLDKDSAKMPWAVIHYSDLYTMSSGLMHCDIVGLESQVDSGGYDVETPPSDQYVVESLISSHWAIFWALASYASIAGLPKAHEYGDRLLKSYEEVWGEGSRELEDLRATSPGIEDELKCPDGHRISDS